MFGRKKIDVTMVTPEEGEEMFAFSIPYTKKKQTLKDISLILSEVEGFRAFHFVEQKGILLFFDTLNHAKIGRNILSAECVPVSDKIVLFAVENGVPTGKGAAD